MHAAERTLCQDGLDTEALRALCCSGVQRTRVRTPSGVSNIFLPRRTENAQGEASVHHHPRQSRASCGAADGGPLSDGGHHHGFDSLLFAAVSHPSRTQPPDARCDNRTSGVAERRGPQKLEQPDGNVAAYHVVT